MSKRKIIVTGDRILVKPDTREDRTKVGLYLPQTVKEKEEVIGGYVVDTGPGLPLADPAGLSDEPWKRPGNELKYLPVEAQAGDFVLFLQKAAVEINFEGEKYMILPQSAILIIVRDDDRGEESEDQDDKPDGLDFY